MLEMEQATGEDESCEIRPQFEDKRGKLMDVVLLSFIRVAHPEHKHAERCRYGYQTRPRRSVGC